MRLISIADVIKKLEEAGIEVSENFMQKAEKMQEIGGERLYDQDVSEVLKFCSYWRSAIISEEEYNKFVEYVLLRLYRIHCCTVNNNPVCKKICIQDLVQTNPKSPLLNTEKFITTRISRGSLANVPGRFVFK